MSRLRSIFEASIRDHADRILRSAGVPAREEERA